MLSQRNGLEETKQNTCERKESIPSVKPISQQATAAFSAYYPTFIEHVLQEFAEMRRSDQGQIKEMLDYNLPHGHRRMPYFMLSAYYEMEKSENMDEKKVDLVNLMAWCLHLKRASYQILDDIADGTETRSERSCWHRRIGMAGVIDGLLLSALIPSLLRRHFSTHEHYCDMLELFNRVILKSCVGERIQLSRCDWKDMTVDRWRNITYNKTSWYQCVMPFKTAMFLTETYEEAKFEIMLPILLDIGILLQMINDHADVFPIEDQLVGNPTDIQNGVCSWLLVHALQFSSPSQRLVIEENYGRKDEIAVRRVRDVYIELGLKKHGEVCQEQIYKDIIKRIDDLPQDYPKQALKNGLEIAYQGY